MSHKRLVLIETPYIKGGEKNVSYLHKCLRDSILRGEVATTYHGLYTQLGVLDEKNPIEQIIGIDSELAMIRVADAVVVYTDLGVTKDMEYVIKAAVDAGKTIEYRKLYPNEAH